MAFHHPYNFIPVTGKLNGQTVSKPKYDQVKERRTAARHDLWLKDCYSGRVICRLHLDTPTVVGAKQEEDPNHPSKLKLVKPYRRDGQLAIPGNSLRGMIGSITETLSQSSLRVLEDRFYSVREPVDEGRSAIGLLLESTKPDRCFDLLPLTIPALKTQGDVYQLPPEWNEVFKVKGGGTAQLQECLPVYVDGYTSMRIARGTRLNYQPGSFLDNERPTSYSPDTPGFYYALLAGVPCQPAGDPISVDHSAFKEKPYTDDSGNITYTLIGQRLANVPNAILSEEEWNKLGKPVDYIKGKGILRVLGIDGREEGMPSTKKHELFVPYSPSNPRRRIPVPDDVIKQFRSLAKERHTDEEDLPYSLEGYPGWEPQAGQLFFFDVKLENGRPVVSKISISSIWRKAADGSTWDFFSEIDPDLLPWNPKRTKLTPAELMFGVVEDRKASDDEESEEGDDEESGEDVAEEAEAELPPARALASRVRFHDALPLPGQTVGILNHPIMLKILSSPKPPSPALYFHPKNGNQGVFIKKTDLSKDRHHPNGRKVYLHHPQASLVPDASGKYPWETKDDSPKTAEQKLRCTPLQDKQDFFFHIDFDNLTKAELTLLLTSLRPSDSFRHRLGLGKSLGLGTVCVDIEGVFFIDRHKRYGREALSEPRYHKAWRPQPVTAKPDWDPLYPEEAGRLVELSQTGELATGDLKQVKFYSDSLIDRRTLGLLNTVGDPAKLKPNASVHTPLLSSQIDSVHPEKAEQETFQWFVENDRRGRQALPPIASGQPLPVLQTDPPGNPAGQGQNRRRTNRR